MIVVDAVGAEDGTKELPGWHPNSEIKRSGIPYRCRIELKDGAARTDDCSTVTIVLRQFGLDADDLSECDRAALILDADLYVLATVDRLQIIERAFSECLIPLHDTIDALHLSIDRREAYLVRRILNLSNPPCGLVEVLDDDCVWVLFTKHAEVDLGGIANDLTIR